MLKKKILSWEAWEDYDVDVLSWEDYDVLQKSFYISTIYVIWHIFQDFRIPV